MSSPVPSPKFGVSPTSGASPKLLTSQDPWLSPRRRGVFGRHLLGSVLAVRDAVRACGFDTGEKTVQSQCDKWVQNLFSPNRGEQGCGATSEDVTALDLAETIEYTGTTLDWVLGSRSEGSTVRTATVPGTPWQLVAGTITVPATVMQLVSLLTDDTKKERYDMMFKRSIEHVHVDDTTSVKTLVYKGVWPVADRKFHVCSTWQPSDFAVTSGKRGHSKGAVVGTRSIAPSFLPPFEEDESPEMNTSSCVLGRIFTAGFAIEPDYSGEQATCRVTMVSHIDFAGDMPASIINYIQTTVMPGMLSLIRRHAPAEAPQPEGAVVRAFVTRNDRPATNVGQRRHLRPPSPKKRGSQRRGNPSSLPRVATPTFWPREQEAGEASEPDQDRHLKETEIFI